MQNMLMKLWKDEEAPTAVEYGIMVFLIAIVMMVTVGPLGLRLQALFGEVTTQIGG